MTISSFFNIPHNLCDRCTQIGDIQMHINVAESDLSEAMQQQDDYAVVLTRYELADLHEELASYASEKCTCKHKQTSGQSIAAAPGCGQPNTGA